jgi:hypothetical protein
MLKILGFCLIFGNAYSAVQEFSNPPILGRLTAQKVQWVCPFLTSEEQGVLSATSKKMRVAVNNTALKKEIERGLSVSGSFVFFNSSYLASVADNFYPWWDVGINEQERAVGKGIVVLLRRTLLFALDPFKDKIFVVDSPYFPFTKEPFGSAYISSLMPEKIFGSEWLINIYASAGYTFWTLKDIPSNFYQHAKEFQNALRASYISIDDIKLDGSTVKSIGPDQKFHVVFSSCTSFEDKSKLELFFRHHDAVGVIDVRADQYGLLSLKNDQLFPSLRHLIVTTTSKNARGIRENFLSENDFLTSISLMGLRRITCVELGFLSNSNFSYVDLRGGENFEFIGYNFLLNNKKLESIDLNPLRKLGSLELGFLYGCINLRALNLYPVKSVRSISYFFLAYCINLERINFKALRNVRVILGRFLEGCPKMAPLLETIKEFGGILGYIRALS